MNLRLVLLMFFALKTFLISSSIALLLSLWRIDSTACLSFCTTSSGAKFLIVLVGIWFNRYHVGWCGILVFEGSFNECIDLLEIIWNRSGSLWDIALIVLNCKLSVGWFALNWVAWRSNLRLAVRYRLWVLIWTWVTFYLSYSSYF